MPFFAIAHNYAFSYKDFIDPRISFVARMPFYYALRDAFGLLDLVENTKSTLRGEGMDYREFEPAEGLMHQGAGRDRRIRAGLRYSKGGQRKYWLPKTNVEPPGRAERVVNRAITRVTGHDREGEVYAPLLPSQAEDVVHLAPDLRHNADEEHDFWDSTGGGDGYEDGFELPFGDLDDGDEELFEHSKAYVFGDYNYPCIDVSSEGARREIWTEEERVLRDERGAWFSPIRGAKGRLALQGREGPAWEGYGAVGVTPQQGRPGGASSKSNRRVGNVIDHEQERVEPVYRNDADESALKLRWTNVHGRDVESPAGASSRLSYSRTSSHTNIKVPSHDRTPDTKPSGKPSTGLSSPGGSNQSSGNPGSSTSSRARPSPMVSRVNSRDSRGGSRGSSRLPPDAVDLVVEDNIVAEQEHTRERRKGDPTTRGAGLKKVYRRGFREGGLISNTITDEVEVGVGQYRVGTGKGVLDNITTNDEETRQHQHSHESPSWQPDDSELVVARAETPPKHAQLSPTYDHDTAEHHNPWA